MSLEDDVKKIEKERQWNMQYISQMQREIARILNEPSSDEEQIRRNEEQVKRFITWMNSTIAHELDASGANGWDARLKWTKRWIPDAANAKAAIIAYDKMIAARGLAEEQRQAFEKSRKAGEALLKGFYPKGTYGVGYESSLGGEGDEDMEDENVEFQSQEHADEMKFGDDDMEVVAYDDNALDRILVGAKPKRKRRTIPKGKGGMRPATAQDIQSAIARTPAQNRAALAQRIQQTQGLTGGYGPQQPGMGYPGGYGPQQPGMGYPYQQDAYGSYADEYMESDPGGYYTTDSFPQEGFEGIAAGAVPQRRRPPMARRPGMMQRMPVAPQHQPYTAPYPLNYAMPVAYDQDYFQSDPGGYYSHDSFPDEGSEGLVAVGSWGSFWKKFKGVFKTIFKGASKSGMVKTALNAYSPGAGDAAEKGLKLIDSAASGNKDALAQVKAVADAAKAGKTEAQPAHDLLTTINDARKEAKTETVTAAVGATLATGIESLIGRYFKILAEGKEKGIILRIKRVMPEAAIEVESPQYPGKTSWMELSRLYEEMIDKKLAWVDEKGTPVAVGGGGGGFHHGGHGGGWGMLRMDPRDLYLGPRIDVDDDGQPVFVGRHGHHGGHGGGWGGYGGWGWGGYPGLWAPPMWEEVTFIEEEDEKQPGVKVKKPVKAAPTAVGGGGGGGGGGFHHHGGLPSGVMMGPGWGDYTPYPYPGADPWMFEEIEYQNEVGKKENK